MGAAESAAWLARHKHRKAIQFSRKQALAKKALKRRGNEHVAGRSPAGLAVGVQQEDLVAPSGGQIQVVEAHKDCPVARCLLAQQLHNGGLVL